MAALTVSAVALPAVALGLGNVISSTQDSLGSNGGAFVTNTGSGGSDTISNVALLLALAGDTTGLLYSLLNTTYTDIPAGATALLQFQQAFLVLGGSLGLGELGIAANASAIAFACASGAKPTLTITTSAVAVAYFRLRLTASIAA